MIAPQCSKISPEFVWQDNGLLSRIKREYKDRFIEDKYILISFYTLHFTILLYY